MKTKHGPESIIIAVVGALMLIAFAIIFIDSSKKQYQRDNEACTADTAHVIGLAQPDSGECK